MRARRFQYSNVRFTSVMLVVFAAALRDTALAQFSPPENFSTRSRSGQFIVSGTGGSSQAAPLARVPTNVNFIRLDPTLAAVSCERIKQELANTLGSTAAWRGRVALSLYPAEAAGETVAVTSELFRDGWQYRVDLPDFVERDRYVRAIVQVLLLEMANRNAPVRSAELPLWLLEGLTQQILATKEIQKVLPPPTTGVNGLKFANTIVNARRDIGLEPIRQRLRTQSPLSFEQLSWPAAGVEEGADEFYGSSALLFVSELLRLNDGAACFRAMLAGLPEHLNWQFAFLRAFHNHFERALDVEKWWALQVVHFTGRDLAQTWPLLESCQNLDHAVISSLEVRTVNNQLPLHTEATLQAIIREWDRPRQTAALVAKLRELELLRPRIARELAEIVDGYHSTIETYLKNRDKLGYGIPYLKKARVNHAIEDALKQLTDLDAARLAIRAKTAPLPITAR